MQATDTPTGIARRFGPDCEGSAQTKLLGSCAFVSNLAPLHTARASDLKAGDFVIVECTSCGHDGLIHPAALLAPSAQTGRSAAKPSLGLGRMNGSTHKARSASW
jgi:hypothetical protein